MLSKKSLTEDVESLKENIEELKNQLKIIEQKQSEVSKILEELEEKISFLNVLSAKINTTYYHITYEIDDKLKNFLSDVKENLEAIIDQIEVSNQTEDKPEKTNKRKK